MTITLPPETEAKLRQRAAATGEDPQSIVLSAVEAKLAQPVPASMNYGQWSTMFREWIDSHAAADHVADDSREAIYKDRGA
jgi:hypothetical protein